MSFNRALIAPVAEFMQAMPKATKALHQLGQRPGAQIREEWYEKLGRWGDARDAYKARQAENPREIHWALGRLRCEHALGEWKVPQQV